MEGRRALFNWSRLLIIGHGLIVIFSLLTGWWMLAVLITLAPFYGGGFQYLLNVAQHIGLTDRVNDYRPQYAHHSAQSCAGVSLLADELSHRASYVRGSALLQSARIAHAREGRFTNPCQGVIGTWLQVIPILRRQQREPDYMFLPELP